MASGAGQFSAVGRTIVIGAGLMGRHHAAAIHRTGSQVVAIVDRNLDLARSVARRYGGALACSYLGEAVERAAATIAHLCTPADTHPALAKELAAAKLHTLIEKPVAGTAAETREVLKAFAQTGMLACPVHQYAFQQSVEQALAALPRLGRLRRIAFNIRSAGGGEDAGAFDRVAGDIVPHPLSVIQRLLPGVDVGALDWQLHRAAPGEWLASAASNGTLLSIAISMGGRPTRFATSICGANGTFELDNFHDFLVYLPGTVSRSSKVALPLVHGGKMLGVAAGNLVKRALQRESAYPGLRTLTHRFHRAAQSADRIAVPISPADAIAVAVARDALLAQCPDEPRA